MWIQPVSTSTAADQSKIMQEQMSGAAMAMPPDPKAAFKAEWEALEITEHRWALAGVESELLAEAAKWRVSAMQLTLVPLCD